MEELICLPRFSVSSGEGSKTPAFPDRVPSDWLRGTLAATEAPLLPPGAGPLPPGSAGGSEHAIGSVGTESGGSQSIARRASNTLPSVAHFSPGALSPRARQAPPATRQPSTAVPSTTGPTGHYGPLRSDGAASSGDSFSLTTRQCPRPRARCCSGPCCPCPDRSPRLLCTQGCQCGVP